MGTPGSKSKCPSLPPEVDNSSLPIVEVPPPVAKKPQVQGRMCDVRDPNGTIRHRFVAWDEDVPNIIKEYY